MNNGEYPSLSHNTEYIRPNKLLVPSQAQSLRTFLSEVLVHFSYTTILCIILEDTIITLLTAVNQKMYIFEACPIFSRPPLSLNLLQNLQNVCCFFCSVLICHYVRIRERQYSTAGYFEFYVRTRSLPNHNPPFTYMINSGDQSYTTQEADKLGYCHNCQQQILPRVSYFDNIALNGFFDSKDLDVLAYPLRNPATLAIEGLSNLDTYVCPQQLDSPTIYTPPFISSELLVPSSTTSILNPASSASHKTPVVTPRPRYANRKIKLKWQCLYPACTKYFTRPSDCKRHITTVHSKIRHHCALPGCPTGNNNGRGYCREEKLKSHWLKNHGGQRQRDGVYRRR